MSTIKKFITLMLLYISTSSGCALSNSPARVIVPEPVKINNADSEAGNQVIDVGKGKKGGDIYIALKFDQTFNTKSEDGGRTAKVTDIAAVKVYLTINRDDPLNPGFVKAGTGLKVFDPVNDSGSKLFIFKNVPPSGNGTNNFPYSIAVELFDANGVNLIQPVPFLNNILRNIALSTRSVIVENVSNKLTYLDAAIVTGTYPFSPLLDPQPTPPLPPLQVFPALKNAFGATLDATITPTDGVYPSGVAIEFPL